jgi:SPP1 gp7 family putative phage head morphogenesis protein
MAISPEQIHDLVVNHRIALNRYSTGVVRKVVALLNRSEASIVERLARTGNETVAGQRLEELLTELRAIQRDGWVLIKARLNGDVDELAKAEAEFAARLVGAPTGIDAMFSPLPTDQQIIAAVKSRPFQGRALAGWLDDTEEQTAARVRDTIRQGFVEGRTTDQIVRALRGTKAAQYKDGVMEVSRRSAEAVVRTALTHTSNVAQQTTFEAMGVTHLIWTSTLDGRTSLVCASRSEKVFPIKSGPRPPAHWNCRSVMRPKVKEIPGVAPFNPPSYADWLKRQPASVQDDILGPTRGRLYRSGNVSIDRFVDRAGQVIGLDALRARDASAFAAAGL